MLIIIIIKIWKIILKTICAYKEHLKGDRVSIATWNWSPPPHRATISLSLPAFVLSRNQETVPLSHDHILPPAKQFHRASCHQHAATVSPWDLVRHLVRHRANLFKTMQMCRCAAVIPTRHIGIPPYTSAPDSCQSYFRTSWHCLTQFHHMVCC